MPELATVGASYVLNAGLTMALAAATASVAEHPSTAAILTLTVTVGTWVINFIGDTKGGIWERAAGHTPTAMVAEFQHGLVRSDVVLIALTHVLAAHSGSDLDAPGVAVRRRVYGLIALGAITMAIIFACTSVRVCHVNGLFEQTGEHYGEISYELDGHRTMSRSTTAEGVIETSKETTKLVRSD